MGHAPKLIQNKKKLTQNVNFVPTSFLFFTQGTCTLLCLPLFKYLQSSVHATPKKRSESVWEPFGFWIILFTVSYSKCLRGVLKASGGHVDFNQTSLILRDQFIKEQCEKRRFLGIGWESDGNRVGILIKINNYFWESTENLPRNRRESTEDYQKKKISQNPIGAGQK